MEKTIATKHDSDDIFVTRNDHPTELRIVAAELWHVAKRSLDKPPDAGHSVRLRNLVDAIRSSVEQRVGCSWRTG